MKINTDLKIDIKNVKLTNYSEFTEVVKNNQTQELDRKRKESEAYIEYIKLHDKEAYEKYLSYATYLKTCVWDKHSYLLYLSNLFL